MSLCRFLPVPSDRMGIVWSLLSIKDSVVLEYGPAGTTHFSMGLYGTLGVEWRQSLFTTHMSEDDVIMGDVTRLEEAIVEIDESQHPKVIFVVTSSIAAVIGTDIKGVCNYMQSEVKAKLIAVDRGGFRGDYSKGILDINTLLVKKLAKPVAVKDEKSFNVLGASMGRFRMQSDIWEIKNMMEEGFGFHLNTSLCADTSVEELQNLATAKVNIVLSYEALEAAQLMEKKYGIPYVYKVPYGYQATMEFLEAVAAALDVEVNAALMGRLQEKNAELAMYKMMGRKKTHLAAFLKGDYDTIMGIAAFVASTGIKISHKICTHSLKPIPDCPEDVEYYADEKDYLNCLAEMHKALILGDDITLEEAAADNMKVRISAPFVNGAQVAKHLPLMGEKGADYLLEAIDAYFWHL